MAFRSKYSKRIRSLKTIDKKLDSHRVRHEKHLLWSARNEKYSERRGYHCAEVSEKILELKRSNGSYKRILGVFRSTNLTAEATEKLHGFEVLLAEGECKALLDVPELDFPFERYPNERCDYSDWVMIPRYLILERQKAMPRELKKKKQNIIKARVAKADDTTRALAVSVKQRLPQNHLCPYCGSSLGKNPHADHIYPVSRGGLSTLVNMVYVCADCNMKKKGNTLTMFICEFGLDRKNIEKQLRELGKEF